MNAPREVWLRKARCLAQRVLVFSQVDSTNNIASQMAAEPANAGTAILAEEQTAGRGQHGRSWLSDAGASVLLSLLLTPPEAFRRPAFLTAWAAVAVCNLVQEITGIAPRIKWPNDVYLRDRKVCGILIEQNHGGPSPATIVGVGLNVQQTSGQLADFGLTQATSLSQFSPTPLITSNVAMRLLEKLDETYFRLLEGDRTTLESAWTGFLGLAGQQVMAECQGGFYQGILTILSFDLVSLSLKDGQPIDLKPESILHLFAFPASTPSERHF
jgi:BirA family biotin operon repressor/biotin-[acetyl-CoA-carboxylase] ligase